MSIGSIHRKSLRPLLLIALLGILIFSGTSAQEVIVIPPLASATFTVNTTDDTLDANPGDGTCADSSGQCSIRAAITEANFTSDADTINIPAGNYKVTREGDDDTNENGDFDILESLTIVGAGIEPTIIEGANFSSVASPGAVTFSISSLTITNSVNKGCTRFSAVGAVMVGDDDTLAVNNLNIANITGCAIISSGTATITDTVIRNNTVGAIKHSGTMTIEDSTISGISGERAVYSYGGEMIIRNTTIGDSDKGAITNEVTTMLIEDSILVRNSATDGGAILLGTSFNGPGDTTVRRTVIAANEATEDGGGIWRTNLYGTVPVTIEDSLISGNSAGDRGGGIMGKGIFRNVTIAGNIAGQTGGGVYITGTTEFYNTTLSKNQASQRGGGIYVDSATTMENTILAGNTASVQAPDCYDVNTNLTSGGNNIVGNDTTCTRFTATGDQPNTNPNLAAELADNGGPTCTIAIETGSPAINPAVVGTPTAADQRGAAAVGNRDIGAFEFNGVAQAKNATCDFGNETPVAANDAYVTQFGTQLTVSTGDGVLKNDTDADAGDSLTAVLKTNVSNGTMTFNSDGSFNYTPGTSFSGTDTFTYAAFDGQTESEPATVTLTVTEQPGNEPPQAPDSITVETNQGRPTISWDYDVNAQWFQIWIGNSEGTVHFEWYPANPEEAFVENQAPVTCNGIVCSVKPNINPSAGAYDVWMQSWGYGSFATGGPINTAPSWNGPAKFTLSSTPPGPVTGLTVTIGNGGAVTLGWQGAERATWYNVWLGTDGTADPAWQPSFFNWMLAEYIGCENAGLCTLTNGAVLADGSTFELTLPSGEYIWYVQSWGPGGFSTGGSFDPPLDPWVEADKFTVP